MPDTLTSPAPTPAQDRIGPDGLMTLDEAAAYLRLCRATIENMVARGELPDVRLGRRTRRVPRAAVVAYANKGLKGDADA